jgi:hypothetical protein
MALFAAEAATAGVPAVVGGYWAPDVAGSLPANAIPPTAYVLPDQLESTIERLVRDESERRSLGRRANEFVMSRWSPDRVAERVLSLVNGDGSDVVIRQPSDLRYTAGWGMPIDTQRETVRNVIAAGGDVGLGLMHNPTLQTLIIADARNGQEHGQ